MGTPRSRSRRTAAGATLLVALGMLAICASAASARYLYVGEFGTNEKVFGFNMNISSGQLTSLPSVFTGAGGRNIAISPDGRWLYAATGGTSVAVLGVNQGTGALTQIAGSPFPGGSLPSVPVTSPDGRWLFVTNTGASDSVSAYSVNGTTGALTQVGGSPFSTGDGPIGAALTPDGRFLYTANITADSLSAFSVNQTTGQLTAIPGLVFAAGADPASAAVDPAGRYLYVSLGGTTDAIRAYAINAGTGGLTQISGSPFAAGNDPFSMAIAPRGLLYAGNLAGSTVSAYTINSGNGQLSQIAGSAFGGVSSPEQLALAPDGRFLYIPNQVGDSVTGYSISGSTGQLAQISGSPFATPASVTIGGNAVVPDQPPVASFAPSSGAAGQATTFDASGSADMDGTVARYDWSFGDGSSASDAGPMPSHTYSSSGTYTVALTVTDNEGCSTSVIYTGQTALCNGGSRAQATQQVQIVSAGEQPVGQPAPELKLDGKKRQRLAKRKGISVAVSCLLAACEADVGAGVRLPRSRNGGARGAKRSKAKTLSLSAARTQSLAAGETATVEIRYTNRAFKLLRRALRRRKQVRARVTATLVGAGQGTTASFAVKLVSSKKRRR